MHRVYFCINLEQTCTFPPTKHSAVVISRKRTDRKSKSCWLFEYIKSNKLSEIVLLRTKPHIRAPVARRFCRELHGRTVAAVRLLWKRLWGRKISYLGRLHSLEWNPPAAMLSRRCLSRENLLFTLFRAPHLSSQGTLSVPKSLWIELHMAVNYFFRPK